MPRTEQKLACALDAALAQYFETMGESFPVVPILDAVDDPEFWAVAEMDGDTFRIRVSTGTADSTTTLWTSAFADEKFRAGFGREISTDASTMAHNSLVWLMLHELHHFQMGHLENAATRQSSKADVFGERGLVTRAKKSTASRSPDVAKASLILEMQADHDATEMLLDAYSSDEWISLRARVAAISAVMMLIERADSSNQTHGATHPKAATRIFQLLGHVVDMPLLFAHSELNQSVDQKPQPAQMEQERFAAQVLVPVFFDAISLARVALAHSVTDDLGSATDFFNDVQTAKLELGAQPLNMFTKGAREWAELFTQKSRM